jgi:hypothetical protein
MLAIRCPLVFLLALPALVGCANHPDSTAPTGPAVAMPQIQAAIDNATPDTAQRGMSNKTWLWTRGGGPAQIHYSTADGTDFVWLVGERRIFAGQWRIAADPNPRGRTIVQICLRYPGAGVAGLSEGWSCRPAGTLFYDMTERESGDPLRLSGRTQAQFVLDKVPASLAEVEARVVASR